MKKMMLFVFALMLCALTGCSTFEGTWVLSSGKEEKGCFKKMRFLDGQHVQIETEEEPIPYVHAYEQVGKNLYKLDVMLSSLLLEIREDNDKLFVKQHNDHLCLYQQMIE